MVLTPLSTIFQFPAKRGGLTGMTWQQKGRDFTKINRLNKMPCSRYLQQNLIKYLDWISLYNTLV
jgi:hypothetical protein